MHHYKHLILVLSTFAISSAFGDSTGRFENYLVPSWGDLVWNYGPGTDPAMDTPEALEKMFKLWQARGYTGINLRTDLAQLDPSMIRRNPPKKRLIIARCKPGLVKSCRKPVVNVCNPVRAG